MKGRYDIAEKRAGIGEQPGERRIRLQGQRRGGKERVQQRVEGWQAPIALLPAYQHSREIVQRLLYSFRYGPIQDIALALCRPLSAFLRLYAGKLSISKCLIWTTCRVCSALFVFPIFPGSLYVPTISQLPQNALPGLTQ